MERSQLEYFLAIIDNGGFTAAADALALSQPSLSNAMKALERELGVPLFHRLWRGARVTAAGEVFSESARRILEEFDRARISVQSVEDSVVGMVDLITTPGLLIYPLAGMIGRFRERHPGAVVHVLHAEQVDDVQRAVASGRADLGLSDITPSGKYSLRSHLVSEQDMVALVPARLPQAKAHTLSLEELLDMDLVTGPHGTKGRDLLEREAQRLGREFRPALEVGLRGAGLYFVLAGVATAVLPQPFAEFCMPGNAAVVPIEPRQHRTAFLLHRLAPLSPAANALHRIALSQHPAIQ